MIELNLSPPLYEANPIQIGDQNGFEVTCQIGPIKLDGQGKTQNAAKDNSELKFLKFLEIDEILSNEGERVYGTRQSIRPDQQNKNYKDSYHQLRLYRTVDFHNKFFYIFRNFRCHFSYEVF